MNPIFYLAVFLLFCQSFSLEDQMETHKIPLLMKTLRLRPFSGNNLEYIPEVQLKQLRLRPSLEIVDSDEFDDSSQKEKHSKITGWNFVANGESHSKIYRYRILPHPIPRLNKMRRHRFPLIECRDNHRQQVKNCFENYFNNYGIELIDNKLPPISEVRSIFKENSDFELNRQKHDDFKSCYKNTPFSCYESRNLVPILMDSEDSDEYAALFTSAEFLFKDRTTHRLISCFLDHLESFEFISETDNEEDKIARCVDANLKIQRGRNDFRNRCSQKISDKIDQWLTVFVRRQSIGQFCPKLIANKKSLPF